MKITKRMLRDEIAELQRERADLIELRDVRVIQVANANTRVREAHFSRDLAEERREAAEKRASELYNKLDRLRVRYALLARITADTANEIARLADDGLIPF